MSLAHLKIILANRKGEHEHQVGVRYDVLERAVLEFKAMADRVCSCERAPPELVLRDRPDDAPFFFARFSRMNGEDARALGLEEMVAETAERV